MTIPPLTPILDAVRDVRAKYVPDAAAWAADILAGDARALAVGKELMAAIDSLTADLATLIDDPLHADDDLLLEHIIGVVPVIDAVLIAIGEDESDDPEVNERFWSARLERRRRWYEQWIEDLLVRASARELTDAEAAVLDQCEHDLDLIAAGIEPE